MLALIGSRLRHVCSLDSHAGEDGSYTVLSAYFDDYRDSCYYDNENGSDPKEKFRIRIYNSDMGRIALECKRKHKGMTHKDSCQISRELCDSIFCDDRAAVQRAYYDTADSEGALLRKFILRYQTDMLRPKAIIRYERTPYVYAAGNVRITFDRNIEVSASVDSLVGEKTFRPVMPTGYHVLEVKYDEFFPDFFRKLLQLEQLQWTSCSKYYIGKKLLNNKGEKVWDLGMC